MIGAMTDEAVKQRIDRLRAELDSHAQLYYTFDAPQISDGMKAASVMFATLPILVVYPWLQRYFIKGVSLGAVKG